MANIFRAPLYVPKPSDDRPWVGTPKAVPLALIAALVPTFFLHGTRQANAVPEPVWTVESQPSPLTLTLPPAVTLPFSNKRTFYFAPEPGWLGEPTATPLLLELAQIPYAVHGNRRFDLVPEPGWVDTAPPEPLVLTLPPLIQLPFSNARRFDYVPEPGWTDVSQPLSLLLEAAIPPFTVSGTRQFNYVPEPVWVNETIPTNLLLYTTPIVTLPFSNPRNLIPVPEPWWVEGGGSIPEVLLQLPAQPPFTVRGTKQFNYVPEPGWTANAQSVNLPLFLPPPVVLPFSNPRYWSPAPEVGWQGEPSPAPLLLELSSVPPFFGRTQRFDYVDQPGWVGDSSASPLLLELAVPPFTVKGTRHADHTPEPFWLGKPRPVPFVLIPPAALLVLPFSNPRHFEHVPQPAPVQHGPPVPLVLLPPPLPPVSHGGPAWRRLWNQYRLAQGHPQIDIDEERDRERILKVLEDIFGKDFLEHPPQPSTIDAVAVSGALDEDDEEVIALWLSL